MRAAGLLASLVVVSVAGAAPSYVGSARCRVCHLEEHRAWSATAHARSFARLSDAERTAPGCLPCHATGGSAQFPEVGCESCHGPGSDYIALSVMVSRDAAIAAGLRIADASACDGCHRAAAPHPLRPFSYDDARARGVHPVPEERPTGATVGVP